MDPSELDRQAEALINKRLQEVSRLLPQTMYDLTQPETALFADFAAQFSPTGHERNLTDAYEFCRYLKKHTHETVCRSEMNWVRFLRSRRLCSVHFVRDLMVGGKPCRAIQFFYRKRGDAHGRAWRIGS